MSTQPTGSTRMPGAPATASWGRRILALIVDWFASWLVAGVIFGPSLLDVGNGQWQPLLVFWLESSLGVAFAGASFGQLVVRIRVHRTDGRPLDLLRALLRQAMVCLVVPPLVFKEDGRGLHDLMTDSGAYDLLRRG